MSFYSTEEEIKKARLVFLDETVQFYSEDVTRRAIVNNGDCQYRTNDGRKCAIGRHIPDDKYYPIFEGISIIHMNIIDILLPEVYELGSLFLTYVQKLHDNNLNWNESGLSENGQSYYEIIKRQYCI